MVGIGLQVDALTAAVGQAGRAAQAVAALLALRAAGRPAWRAVGWAVASAALAHHGRGARNVAVAAVLLIRLGIHAHAAAAPLPHWAAGRSAGLPVGWADAGAVLADFRRGASIVAATTIRVGAKGRAVPVFDGDSTVAHIEILRALAAAVLTGPAGAVALAAPGDGVHARAHALAAALVGSTCVVAGAAIELSPDVTADAVAATGQAGWAAVAPHTFLVAAAYLPGFAAFARAATPCPASADAFAEPADLARSAVVAAESAIFVVSIEVRTPAGATGLGIKAAVVAVQAVVVRSKVDASEAGQRGRVQATALALAAAAAVTATVLLGGGHHALASATLLIQARTGLAAATAVAAIKLRICAVTTP
jgi:hypothetical protein